MVVVWFMLFRLVYHMLLMADMCPVSIILVLFHCFTCVVVCVTVDAVVILSFLTESVFVLHSCCFRLCLMV